MLITAVFFKIQVLLHVKLCGWNIAPAVSTRSYRLHFQGLAVLELNREVRWTNGLFEYSTLKIKARRLFQNIRNYNFNKTA